MEKYDLIFSLGFSCGVSQALRAAGLQFASFPLDWTGSPDILASARIVATDFAGWLEPEDLELVDVRHGPGFNTRIYLNRKTRLGYSHEFSDFERFETSYPKVRRTYDRRVALFIERMKSSKRILAVFLELPISPRASGEQLREARRLISDRYPESVIDLLYVFEEPGCGIPRVVSSSDGITEVAADYRKFDRGEITHFVEWGPVAKFLRKNYEAEDFRTAEERAGFAADERKIASLRWGPDKSILRRWWNKRMYKLYRSLERILVKRNLVHREGPLWFWSGK